jgi:hypothetical protein
LGRNREGLKLCIDRACEAYLLAFTPPPAVREDSEDGDDFLTSSRREVLLRHGIDMKSLLTRTLKEISDKHGEKRALRFLDYIKGRRISTYSWHQRKAVLEDKDNLLDRINAYWRL